jgi:type VI secretion system protein ImpI
VPVVVRLKIVDTEFHTTFRDTYALLPVRIGRNPLNDVRLSKPQVSQFHAVLELQDGHLMLRDLGSRNGTILRDGRAPAHELVDLADSSHRFLVSTFKFEASLADVEPGEIEVRQARRGLLESEPPPKDRARHRTRYEATFEVPLSELRSRRSAMLDDAPRLELVTAPPAGAEDLAALCDEARASSGRLVQAAVQRAQALPPAQARAMLEWLRTRVPGVERDPDFRRLNRQVDPSEADTERKRLREYVAAQGLEELASYYLPDHPSFTSEDDVLRFLAKVRDVLDALFASFVPLRDGFETMRTGIDVQRPSDRSLSHYDAIHAVRTVTTSAELAQCLLDWRQDLPGARKAVEGVFADLMIHEMALLSGVVRGVQSMLRDISPEAIEAELERRRKNGGVFSGMFRFRELWKVYRERHGDLEDGEKRIFGLVFGPVFAKTYARFIDDGADAEPGGPNTD